MGINLTGDIGPGSILSGIAAIQSIRAVKKAKKNEHQLKPSNGTTVAKMVERDHDLLTWLVFKLAAHLDQSKLDRESLGLDPIPELEENEPPNMDKESDG